MTMYALTERAARSSAALDELARLSYVDLADLDRAEGRVPDGVGGVVGARAGLRDLGDRAGVGAARAHRGQRWPARGPRPLAWATGLGAASSSCSYAGDRDRQVALPEGRVGVAALAFQFASTNLVWELGLVLWVLIGWQFTLAEYLGGLVMIVADGAPAAPFVSPRLEEAARAHAQAADTGHQHHSAAAELRLRERLTCVVGLVGRRPQLPRRLADAVDSEVTAGFLLAGFIGLIGN